MKTIQELSGQQIVIIIAVINAIICILFMLAGIIIGTWIEKSKQRNYRKKMLLAKRKISQSFAPKKTYVVKDNNNNVYGKPYKEKEDEEE